MTEDRLTVRIKSIVFEAERINSYELLPVNGSLPPFTAGAHIDLHLADGLVRSYSLLNDPAERDRYVIGVKRDPDGRGGSRFVHDRLRAGDVITIGPPRNNFEFVERAPHFVLIAGGIGITPILSMVRRAAALERSWELHYASRTRGDAAFIDVLAALERQGGQLRLTFDHEPGGRMIDAGAVVAGARPDAHLYCCGPLPMLEAFEKATQGRPPDHVHVEYFTARDAPAVQGGFDVRLNRSGRTIPVAAGKTILDALLDAGVNVSFACREGVCGTCETRVIEGQPDHRDMFLSDEEKAANQQIMVCCSGANSPVLVLDL